MNPTPQGLPQTTHSPLTPAGQIEQAAHMAAGLHNPRTGWRRAVVVTGLILIAVMAAFTIAAALTGH